MQFKNRLKLVKIDHNLATVPYRIDADKSVLTCTYKMRTMTNPFISKCTYKMRTTTNPFISTCTYKRISLTRLAVESE